MADGIIQVAPDSTGKKVDTSELTVNAQTVERQRIVLADNSDAAGVAHVTNAAPGSSDYGLVVRPIPSGIQTIQGVQDNATAGTITSGASVVGPLAVTQRNVVTVSISGTHAGVSFIIECSDDGGTTWFPLQVIDNGTGQAGSSWTPGTNAIASYDAAIGGFTHVRVRATAWTSGTAVVTLTAQSFAYDPVVAAIAQGLAANGAASKGYPVLCAGWNGTNTYTFKTDTSGNMQVRLTDGTNFMPTGDIIGRRVYVGVTDGSNGPAACKGGSTAPTASDIALVVSQSPNVAVSSTSAVNSAATTNATSIKASSGAVFSISASNTGAAAAFVKFYNKASAPTVGTDVPIITLTIPAGGSVSLPFGQFGLRFSTGIAMAITNLAADTDTTAVAASQVKVLTSYI